MHWLDTPTNPAIPAALEKNSATRQRKSAEITEELPHLGELPAQAVPAPQNPFSKRPLAGLVQPVLITEPRRHDGIGATSMKNQPNQKGMAGALADAKRAAEMSNAPILLLGETGVGKTTHAEQIHAWTGRKGAFVVVDCCSIPAGLMESRLFGHIRGAFTGAVSNAEGAFKLADGGTIFLDEIGDLPLDMQQKLLRVVQGGVFCPVGSAKEITVNVRIVAATHRDLRAEVKAGRFREDLFQRLNVFPVLIPPLRERRAEIPGIIKAACEARGWVLGERVAEVFEFADWPGNVRELLAHVERAAVFGWTHEKAAQEVYRPDTKATPTAGRAGRLAVARDLSAQGWWSAPELALACGIDRATAWRDCAAWVESGQVEARGEGKSARYCVALHSLQATQSNATEAAEINGEVVK